MFQRALMVTFATLLAMGVFSQRAAASMLTITHPCREILASMLDAKIRASQELSRNTPKESYRIERAYPNLIIRNNQIPIGSKPFILWRQNTPPHIPDVVFLMHYLDDEKLISFISDSAGFFDIVAPNSGRLAKPDTALSEWTTKYLADFFEKGQEPFGFSFAKRNKLYGRNWPSKLLKQKFGSLEKLERILGIRLELTKEKKESLKTVMQKTRWLDARYFIEASGKIWLIRIEEYRLLVDAIGFDGEMSHLVLADLIWGDRQESVDLVATGWMYFSKNGQVISTIDTSISGHFNVKNYFKHY
jgi:hypothetical protein